MPTVTLGDIANYLQAELAGDPDYQVAGLMPLNTAQKQHITFLSDEKYLSALASCQAGAIVLKREHAQQAPAHTLIVDDPYLAFAKLAHMFNSAPRLSGIAKTATIALDASIADDVAIADGVVIASGVTIAFGCQIHANVVIGANSHIGEGSTIYPNVTIYHDCQLGKRVIIQAGSVIGSDGFGMAKDKTGNWLKIPQLGRVIIGDDVEIGASTTIDRGALGDTIIEDHVKLDNQIQIAHNVKIGARTAIAACTGIAGSTEIGKDCLIGGHVGINGHIKITNQVMIAAKSAVMKSITEPGTYASTMSVMPAKAWFKMYASWLRVPKLLKLIKGK